MAVNDIASRRVGRLRDMMAQRGYDAVVIRNNPDLRWLTGAKRVFDFEVAHTAFVTADELRLHTDSRYYNAFVERLGADGPWKVDMDGVEAAEWVARNARAARSRTVALEDTNTVAFDRELARAFETASVACLTPLLHGDLCDMRSVKDDEELEAMRAAQAITDAAFDHMCAFIKPGLTEMQLRAELDNYMLANGADALAFDSIVASGPNTANPHAQPGRRRVEEGDFVLMDYGAGLDDYRSDMTRTVVVGEPCARQRELFDLVRRAHEECAAFVKAGVRGCDVHNLAVKIISDAGYGDYFKHGLGHGVGIEIHEQPRFSRAFLGPIPAGSVVTIEPGVYLPGFGGVRLEDCGVVTEGGYEPFTRSTHELVAIPVR